MKEVQSAINSLVAWKFEGSYGRAMMEALKNGECMLATRPCTDYYGNRIPSRTEVKPGSFGSREFVAECMGEEYAAEMEAVK